MHSDDVGLDIGGGDRRRCRRSAARTAAVRVGRVIARVAVGGQHSLCVSAAVVVVFGGLPLLDRLDATTAILYNRTPRTSLAGANAARLRHERRRRQHLGVAALVSVTALVEVEFVFFRVVRMWTEESAVVDSVAREIFLLQKNIQIDIA